ncbi:hypothetical protein GCM10022240_13250 [Microbacterium kribbense]|uniref:Uncharacterized protein n=1 Tax=Microbacterium kribbense TaxID=433645 RepID=A0ABP7GCE8_9MICO
MHTLQARRTAHRAAQDALGTLRVVKPTFAGQAQTVRVGHATYGLPPGYRCQLAQRGQLAYVLGYDGSVHVMTSHGEIVGMPTPLLALIRSHAFGQS